MRHLCYGDSATGGSKSVNGVRIGAAATRSEFVAETGLHRVDACFDLAVEPEMFPLGTKEEACVQHDIDTDASGEARDEMGVGVVRQAVAYRSDIGLHRSWAGVHIVKPRIGPAIDIRLPHCETDKSIRQEIVD